MKTTYYINGKKITKKALTEKIGAEKVKRLTDEAKQDFRNDPFEQLDFFLGSNGMLTIEFV